MLPLGVSRLGSCFAPIVIIWLGFNLGFGIYVCCRAPVHNFADNLVKC